MLGVADEIAMGSMSDCLLGRVTSLLPTPCILPPLQFLLDTRITRFQHFDGTRNRASAIGDINLFKASLHPAQNFP